MMLASPVLLAGLLVTAIWYLSTSWVLSHCGDGLVDGPSPTPPAGSADLDSIYTMPSRETIENDNRPAAAKPADAADSSPSSKLRIALPPISIPPALARHPTVKKRAAKLLWLLEREKAEGTSVGLSNSFEKAASALAQALIEAARNPSVNSGASGDSAGASVTAASSASLAGTDPEMLPEFTQQTCYLQSDESEQCVYDGPVCFDGISPIVVVDVPIRSQKRILDYTHFCSDFRYYETSALDISGCGYGYSSYRPYNASLPIQPGTDYPLPLTKRRWGAQNRNGHLYFREVTPEEVFGPRSTQAARQAAGLPRNLPPRYGSLKRETFFGGDAGVNVSWAAQAEPFYFSPSGAYGASLVQRGPFQHETVRGLGIAARTKVGNRTIDWLDGSLWLAGIDGQWWQNPYHWWTKMGALFDAQRANASAPAGASRSSSGGGDGWGGHPYDGYLHTRYDVPAGPATLNARGGSRSGNSNSDGSSGVEAPGAMAIRREAGKSTWNRASWRVGPQWRLPPMDYVAFTGDGANVLANVTSLHPWFRSTMTLATQPQSHHFFNDLLSSLGDYHYVCTMHGAGIPGTKHKLFTGRGDAWMLRQYAYEAVAAVPPSPSPSVSPLPKNYDISRTPTPTVDADAASMRRATAERVAALASSHPRHPPRKVTIIGRKGQNGRGIYNIDRVVAAVNASGLPYEMVATMASLSFEEQVQLMAGTGLLIAPHGAHLQNIMFLPAHAAVIELWPYLMKKSTYRHLATQLDLNYFPVYSWDLLPMTPPNIKAFYGVELMNITEPTPYYYDNCVAVNISSYEALTEHACNAMSKNYPIIVPFPAFHHVLRDALDAIGAYALANEGWREALDGASSGGGGGSGGSGKGGGSRGGWTPPLPPSDLSQPHAHMAWPPEEEGNR